MPKHAKQFLKQVFKVQLVPSSYQDIFLALSGISKKITDIPITIKTKTDIIKEKITR